MASSELVMGPAIPLERGEAVLTGIGSSLETTSVPTAFSGTADSSDSLVSE